MQGEGSNECGYRMPTLLPSGLLPHPSRDDRETVKK